MAELSEPGPSYSLFVEMAMAVGTTLLALYMCRGKRERSGLAKDQAVEELAANKNETNEFDSEDSNKSRQSSSEEQEIASTTAVSDQPTKDVTSGAAEHQKVCRVIPVEVKATQTEGEELEAENAEDSDLKILWKAVVVNAQEHALPRYRTELYVDVDGVVTHSEGFQKEGIAGVGMKQVLVKVQ